MTHIQVGLIAIAWFGVWAWLASLVDRNPAPRWRRVLVGAAFWPLLMSLFLIPAH